MSEVIATAGATDDTGGSVEDVTIVGRGVLVVISRDVEVEVERTELA